MHIHITLPRPWTLLGILTVAALWYTGFSISHQPVNAAVGGAQSGGATLIAQQTIDRERLKKEVLAQKEEIVRYQLMQLEDEAMQSGLSPQVLKQVNDSRQVVLAVIKEREASDRFLQRSLQQLWEAQGTDFSDTTVLASSTRFIWPVTPVLGISAHFHDEGYKAIFHVDHHAIDIPVNQGTTIVAPADGVVKTVALNGLGYSYVVLSHDDGLETIYGHISAALVQEGDAVMQGSPIAKSGGRPGSPGAGLMTTGPHVHFAVRENGVLVDPEPYLMPYEG